MKRLILGLMLIPFIGMAQSQVNKKTKPKDAQKDSSPKIKVPADFKKVVLTGDSLYGISGTMLIKDGHDVDVKVLFRSSVPIEKWKEITKKKKYSDYEMFDLITNILAVNAKYKLKNSDSFVPLPNQFFMWSNDGGYFLTNFKMMGRNGYGNLSESTVMVTYNPFETE